MTFTAFSLPELCRLSDETARLRAQNALNPSAHATLGNMFDELEERIAELTVCATCGGDGFVEVPGGRFDSREQQWFPAETRCPDCT